MSVSLGQAVGYLLLDTTGFSTGLTTAGGQLSGFQRTMNNFAGSMTGIGNSMTAVGGSLTKNITLPLAGLGGVITKVSSDFEAAMSKVEAISGATGDEVEQLEDKAKEMGATTKFSATEAAEAFQYMAMAGWKTEDMLKGIDGILSLAAADGLDLATTSDIVTDALTAFGLTAKDSGHFADVLARASSSANTNVSMLGESFKYCAPVAGALGYSAEDTAIALGLMANSGIKASSAGTALRTLLTNMAKPTDEMAAAMETLGVSLDDGNGRMLSFREVMIGLRKGFGELKMPQEEFQKSMLELSDAFNNGEIKADEYEEAQLRLMERAYGAEGALKAQTAAMLAGKTGMSGLLAIVNSSDKDFNDLVNSIDNCDGAAKNMADTMMNNLNGQVTILKSSLEGLALQIGEIILPYVKKFVEKVQELVTWFGNLSKEQQEQIVKYAAIAAAIGPCLIVFGQLFKIIGSVTSTISALSSVFTGIRSATTATSTSIRLFGVSLGNISAAVLKVTGVVGALAAVFVTLWKNNEDFRNKVTEIWNSIVEKFQGFISQIQERMGGFELAFTNIVNVIKPIWLGFCDLLAPIFIAAFELISTALGTVLDVIIGILDIFIGVFTGNWEQAWNGVCEIFIAIWEAIKSVLETALNMLLGILDTICGFFGTTWEATWNSIKEFFINLWNDISTWFSETLNSISEFFTNTWNNISTWFSETITNISTTFSTTWTAIKDFFFGLLTSISNFFTGIWNGIKDFISSVLEGIKNVFETIWNAIHEFMTSFWNNLDPEIKEKLIAIKDNIKNAWDAVKNCFETVWNAISDFTKNVITSIKDFITDRMNDIKNLVNTILTAIKTLFTNIWNAIKAYLTAKLNEIKTTVSTVMEFIKSIISTVLNAISSIWNSIWNTIKTFLSNTFNSIKTKISDTMNGIKTTITDILNNIKTTFTNIFNNIITSVTTFASNLKTKGTEAAKGFFDNIVNGLADLPTKMGEIGANIVNGIWNGISSGWTWLKEKVSGLATGLFDAAKSALGIHSPSRKFAWLASMCNLGFINEFESSWKDVDKTATDLISNLGEDATTDMNLNNSFDLLKDSVNNICESMLDNVKSTEIRLAEMVTNIADMLYIARNQYAEWNALSDGTISLGYVHYGNQSMLSTKDNKEANKANNLSSNGDTFIFYSQDKLSEAECAREFRRTKRKMSEGL